VKPVLTADEYRRVDKAYEGDLDTAMDRAGYAVALAAVRAGRGTGRGYMCWREQATTGAMVMLPLDTYKIGALR
jgi:hypothetical protein